MQKVLEKLRGVAGIKGAAVLTLDGMMVASSLSEEFLDDVVAGLCSFLIASTSRSLHDANLRADFSRFTLHATHGKVVLTELGEAYLVVITTQFVRLDDCAAEIDQAATTLRRLATIQI